MIAARIPRAMRTGAITRFFKVEQPDYENQDLRFAFGAIDRLDIEVDFDAQTVHAWFQDSYEWHPFYPGLYTAFPDDGARETNCLHAALVELKDSGAAEGGSDGPPGRHRAERARRRKRLVNRTAPSRDVEAGSAATRLSRRRPGVDCSIAWQ